jgi:acyl carrier protein
VISYHINKLFYGQCLRRKQCIALLNFIREQPIAASISPLDLNTPVEELKLDSLDMVEMMMEMETRLNLKIKDPEEKFNTIHDIVNHIVRSSNKSE